MEYKYQSIVLEHVDVGETDRLYALYTKEAGRILLAANGVRKPQAKLAGNLESITLVEVFAAKNRGRGRITGVIAADNFSALKENLPALEKVFAALKIFNRLVTQEEKDAVIFELLADYLKAMDRSGADEGRLEILTAGFIFKLLSGLGYGLEMKKCADCGAPLVSGGNFFSAALGGTLCLACSSRENRRIRIADETVKFIRIFFENKMENLGKLRAGESNLRNLKLIAEEVVRWVAG